MLETELKRGDTVIDKVSTPFGIRIVMFDAERGMTINGKPVKLRGARVDHDNGLLGAMAFDDAEDRRVRLLKARGLNAIRSSYDLTSRAFADACGRHGMFLIKETFDAWRAGKNPQDYAQYFADNWRSDVAATVLSARNHPSVVMWSICNEIPDRLSQKGIETQWDLANEVHRLDPTRPVTAAINGFAGRLVIPPEGTARAGTAGVADEASAVFLDAVGYNYKVYRYEPDHTRFPKRVMFGTESFPNQLFEILGLTERLPYLIGDFVWTAMDYLGEAGIHSWT